MVNRIVLAGFLLVINFPLAAQENLQFYFSKAQEELKKQNYPQFYEMIVKANEIHPYHPTLLYQRGIAAALTQKNEEAISYLEQAVLINTSLDLEIEELTSLTNLKEFAALKTLKKQLAAPIIQSDTALIIKDRALHPETIVQGEREGTFYLTSVHLRKVVRVDKNKNVMDVVPTAQDGLAAVTGLKVDKQRNVLWAASSPMQEMINFDTLTTAAVFKYHLKSGKLLAKYFPEGKEKNHVFGDLILNKAGEAFVSDSRNNIIYKVNERSQKLEAFYSNDEFWNLQGIAFSIDEQFLFVTDYIKGLYRLHLSTKELIKVVCPLKISLKGIDGLLVYNNSLIAIQNGITPMRVTRYYLSDDLKTITDYKILDRAHPAFNEPTNGCIVNGTLYYVANSQWGGYEKNYELKAPDQLQDIVILKIDLDPGR